MSITDGVFQGISQGITEFLPVSSDGHVTLYQHLTGLSGEGALFFTLMLHLGTLMAVFIVYRRTILALIFEFLHMISDLFRRSFTFRHMSEERSMILMLITATLPLAIFIFAKDFVASLAQDSDIVVEGFCFLFTGSMLYFASKCVKGRKTAKDMTVWNAVLIGLFQGVAILPGVSRSGSTISSGLLLGFSKKFIVQFSFILGIPAILGASVFELKDALASGVEIAWIPILAGVFTAMIVGILCIKLIEFLVVSDRFAVFAYYTFILGTLTVAAGIAEHITGQNIVHLISSLFG